MIARLRGTPAGRTQDGLVLDVAGVGYLVQATPRALARAEGAGEITIDTYLHVREDALQLYGFADVAERRLFEQLLGVSGVGPKVALAIVSGSTPAELRRAIAREDTARFEAIPGDRAQDGAACRARAEGLLGDEEAVEDGDTHVVARDALVELGYSLVDAEAILSKIDPALAPEERVRQALRQAA